MCHPDFSKYDLEEVKKEHIPPGEMSEFVEWEEEWEEEWEDEWEEEEVIQDIVQPGVPSNAEQEQEEEEEEEEDWNNDNHPPFFMDPRSDLLKTHIIQNLLLTDLIAFFELL